MSQNTRELNVNINVDITETIRGLKAIQREAKKAAQALRELEAVAPKLTITSGTIHANSPEDAQKVADKLAEAIRTDYTHDGRRFRCTDFGNGYDKIEEVSE